MWKFLMGLYHCWYCHNQIYSRPNHLKKKKKTNEVKLLSAVSCRYVPCKSLRKIIVNTIIAKTRTIVVPNYYLIIYLILIEYDILPI